MKSIRIAFITCMILLTLGILVPWIINNSKLPLWLDLVWLLAVIWGWYYILKREYRKIRTTIKEWMK